ncbi:hypothetical protein CHS0354_026589 [Potamilus streckersoni]|uniref:Uncharacterized protein n=1 Tax=Potamilus streckersoni TaxID=2493646 RepID=A0AAE0TIQ7_9BIVA|nr:hypothetical protein CHS0354_026589 [Potamilus streckersoni]
MAITMGYNRDENDSTCKRRKMLQLCLYANWKPNKNGKTYCRSPLTYTSKEMTERMLRPK